MKWFFSIGRSIGRFLGFNKPVPPPVKKKERLVKPSVETEADGIDWGLFVKSIEKSKSKPCGPSVSNNRVEALKKIVAGFNKTGDGKVSTLAYGLATCRREVGINFLPVREGFKKTDKAARDYVRRKRYRYGKVDRETNQVYYGRGYVQLTWRSNYEKEGIHFNPDKALEPTFAAELLFKGLLDGRWNGKGRGLRHYLDNNDLKNARRTVNITDHWKEIADYYYDFLTALNKSVIKQL